MLNYICSVVQSYITLTPRDPGLTHIASWCLAFSMFWEYIISTLRVKWVIQLLQLYCQLTCRLSQVTLLLVHGPAQTTEWNMDWWHGSELFVQYPMNKLCQYWTWYQYWIGLKSQCNYDRVAERCTEYCVIFLYFLLTRSLRLLMLLFYHLIDSHSHSNHRSS